MNSQAVPQGTVAFIGSNVTVTSGGSVNVQAKSLVSYNGIVGGLTAGVVGLGGSVEIANIQGNTQAYIDTGSTASAGGNVTVGATLVTDHSNGLAFAGMAAVVGVGAQVVDIQDTSTVSATVNNGEAIPQAQQVLVTAMSNRSLNAQATGGSVGLVVAGAAVAIADAKGSTLASIGSAQDRPDRNGRQRRRLGQLDRFGHGECKRSHSRRWRGRGQPGRCRSHARRSRPRSARTPRFWSDRTSRSLPGPSRRRMPTFPAFRWPG